MDSHSGFYFPPASKDRAVNSMEIKDFIILWTYSQWRQAIVVIPPLSPEREKVLQSARIAQSRESNLDSCRPMSLSSYRLESRRDLQTANKVCVLYPFSPERETCCILPVNQPSHAYFLTKWKKCNIVSLFLQIHIVESTIHHSLMRMDSRQRIVSNACKSLIS